LCSKGDPGNPHREFVAPVLKQKCIAMSFIINVLVTDPFEVIWVVSRLSNVAPFMVATVAYRFGKKFTLGMNEHF
jgi:hypothetical protein